MICKDSVLKWFKGLSSHNRIDLMCSLLNKCLPFELRFMGTCLEDLGRQDFTQMKDFEVKANNPSELMEFQVQCIISDTRTRQKLALYVCLLHSLNTACSTLIYKSLYGIDINEVVSTAKTDSKVLEELLTIYTVAVNHPAFSFEQRSNLGSILLRLSQEENRLDAEKLAESVNADYTQTQMATQCPEPHRSLVNSEVPPPAPQGLNYPPGLGTTGNFIPFPFYPTFPTQVSQPIVWQVLNYPPMAEHLPPADLPPFAASPLMSRNSSPAQSAQHSRAASPVRKNFYPCNERTDLHQKMRPPYSDSNYSTPPPVNSKGPFPDRNIFNSESSGNIENEQLRNLNERMSELSTEEMLHGAVVSLNGIAAPASRGSVPPKPLPRPPFDPEVVTGNTVVYARSLELMPAPMCPPGSALTRIPAPSVSRFSQQNMYNQSSCGVDEVRPCSSSSGSDASSTSHSPPVTPANHQAWEKGYDPDETILQPKPRVGIGRGRGRYCPQAGPMLPRERGSHGPSVRRDGPRSAPTTPHEENKYFAGDIVPPPQAVTKALPPHDVIAGGVTYAAPFLTGPFTTAPPIFPPYPPTFVRPPYSYPNGDVLYTYQPQPPTPFLPSQLVTYSSSVPPPKIACYNCSSQTHHPNDCKEPTMEEYSSKGQYKIDYGKPNDVNSEK